MKTLTIEQVFQHMADNVRNGKSPVDRLQVFTTKGIAELLEGTSISELANDYHQFRIAPRTHTLNGYDVPAPETEEPEVGTEYWVLDSFERDGVCQHSWGGDKCDLFALQNSLWLSKEDAIANRKAMRGENPYER